MDGSLSGHPNARACGAPQHQASGVLLPQSITVPLVPTPPCEREHSTCAPRKVNLSAWRASGSETEGRANLSAESLSGSNAEATLPPGTHAYKDPSAVSPSQTGPTWDTPASPRTAGRATNTCRPQRRRPTRSRSTSGGCFETAAGKPASPTWRSQGRVR